MSIKAKCKNCNQMAPSDAFKLHYEYKMMVCPNCYSGKTKKQQEEKAKKVEKAKPAGWDSVDDYLVKARKMDTQEKKGKFEKIPGTSHVRYTCECKFTFKYDPFRKRPRSCPYCNDDIPRMKTFSML